MKNFRLFVILLVVVIGTTSAEAQNRPLLSACKKTHNMLKFFTILRNFVKNVFRNFVEIQLKLLKNNRMTTF